MSQLASELTYTKEVYLHPSYRLSRILPLSGTQTYTVNNSGGTDVFFELPVNAYNLSESFLEFDMTGPVVAGNYTIINKDVYSPIRMIELYTRSGIYLCSLDNLPNYTKMVWKVETPFEEYETFDKFSSGFGAGNFLRPSNIIGSPAVYAAGPPITVTGPRIDGSQNSTAYTEPQYFEVQNATANAVPVLKCLLQLKRIYNTIFSLNKDILANEILIMRVVWNASNRIFYSSTVAGGAALGNIILTAATAGPVYGFTAFGNTSINIANMTLYLAIEKNLEVVNTLRSMIASPTGLNILIPYIYQFKNGLNGASQTVSLRFNRGHGRRLMKLYHSVFNNNETVSIGATATLTNTMTLPSAYDNDNRASVTIPTVGAVNKSKVQIFYTMLDNERLQEFNLTCSNYDDYMLMRDKLRGSVIQDADMFYYNWLWIEDFSNLASKEEDNAQNLEVGLDLSIERKWDFYGQQMNTLANPGADTVAGSIGGANANGGAYNHYTFAVTQKMLTITSAGITVI